MHIKFWSENLKGNDHSEDLAVDGRIILEWILGGNRWKNVNWMQPVRDMDQWQTVVKTVINFLVSDKARNFLNSSVTVRFSKRTLLHEIS
jgi:hypothetical protein